MRPKFNKAWYETVREICIIRNIKINDINPNSEESLKVLVKRIAASF